MNTVSFTREELYDLVWQNTIVSLSKLYEVSATDIRNACKTLAVPIPEVGYWQKLKFNKPVFKPKLQPTTGVNDITLTKGGNSPHKNEAVLKIEEALKIETNKRSNSHDKLIIEAGKCLRSKDRHVSDGLISSWGEVLQIRVSKINIERALDLFDKIIKAFRVCNHDIFIENRDTIAFVNSEKFKLTLREKLKRVEVPGRSDWNKYDYHPTGILILKWDYFDGKEWTDGKLKLEEQIPVIIAWLEEKTVKIKEQKEQTRRWQAEREIERQKKQTQKKDIENEIVRFKNLLAAAKRYEESMTILSYIEAVKKTNADNTELREWITWAQKKTDWYNPLVNANDEVLDYVDKEKLTIKNPWDFN